MTPNQTGLFFEVQKRQPKYLGDTGDGVRWTSTDSKGKEYSKWKYTACYAPIMGILGDQEILCRSSKKQKMALPLPWHNRLRYHDFERLMNLHKEAGMIPQEVRFFSTRDGNCMLIPRRGWDRHTVYVTLCLYRYADSKPRTMKTILDLYDQLNLPWLQVYHYGMACRNVGAGHGFISFVRGDCSCFGNDQGVNPAAGATLCRFASMPLKERAKLKQGKSDYTYTYTSQWSSEINPMVQAKMVAPGRWNHGQSINKPQFMLRDAELLLDPRLSPIYVDPSLTKEQFAEILGQFKEDELK